MGEQKGGDGGKRGTANKQEVESRTAQSFAQDGEQKKKCTWNR